MFSLAIIFYLFLAGTGSGVYVLSAISLIAARTSRQKDFRENQKITKGGFWLGPLIVAAGAVFLIFDLGSPEKAYLIFFSPRLSVLGFGTWALVLFCLMAPLTFFLRSSANLSVPQVVQNIVEALTLIAALAIMIYAGVFVSSMPALPLLNTPLTMMLLIASSFSAGAALTTLYGLFNQHKKAMNYGLRSLPLLDVVLIVLEIALLATLLLTKYFEGGLAQYSVMQMLFGSGMKAFWLGVVLCGVLAPLSLAIFIERQRERSSFLAYTFNAAGTLLGCFALRYSLVTCGFHVSVF